jgi:hypothetical protein
MWLAAPQIQTTALPDQLRYTNAVSNLSLTLPLRPYKVPTISPHRYTHLSHGTGCSQWLALRNRTAVYRPVLYLDLAHTNISVLHQYVGTLRFVHKCIDCSQNGAWDICIDMVRFRSSLIKSSTFKSSFHLCQILLKVCLNFLLTNFRKTNVQVYNTQQGILLGFYSI